LLNLVSAGGNELLKICEEKKTRKGIPSIPERLAFHISRLSPGEYPSAIIGLCQAMEGCQTLRSTKDVKSFAHCLEGSGKHGRVTRVEQTRYSDEIVQASIAIIGGATIKVYGTPAEFRGLLKLKGAAQDEYQRRSARAVQPLANAVMA
jgi:hypothetical protein